MKLLRLVLSRAALLLGGLILGLLCAEVILRVFFCKPLQTEGAFTEPDPYLGWRHQANWDGRYFVEGRLVPIKFDEHGMRRGRPLAKPKPKGEKRVLFIGDSFTAAFEVPEEKTFIYRLGDRLNAAGREQWETINGGVRGYGADQAQVWLSRKGFALEPDIVIYDFCHNDLLDNLKTKIKCTYALNGDRLGELKLPDYDWLKRKHALKYLYVRRLWRLKGFRDRQPPRLSTPESRARYQELCKMLRDFDLESAQWRMQAALIRKLADECRARGVQLYVVPSVMPFEYDDHLLELVGGDRQRDGEDPFLVHTRLKQVCDRAGVPFIDALAALRRHYRIANREMLWWESDNHYNERGHELMADLLHDALSRSHALAQGD